MASDGISYWDRLEDLVRELLFNVHKARMELAEMREELREHTEKLG